MPFRHHAINGRVRDGLLEREPLHLGFAPGPAMVVHDRVSQRKNNGNFLLARLSLSVNASQKLVILGARPRQNVDDEPIANVLQPVHARADGGGSDEDLQIPADKRIFTRFVVPRVETDLPSIFQERIAQQPVNTLDVIGVNECLRFDVVADDRQAGARENLLQLERSAVATQGPDLIEKRRAIHRNAFFPALIPEHFLVIGHPANAERHEPLVELHAIGHRGPGVDLVVRQAGDQFDHAFAFMEIVDHRCGRHTQNVQIRVALGGKSREHRHQLPSPGYVLDGALLGIVDFIHNDEVNRFALDRART